MEVSSSHVRACVSVSTLLSRGIKTVNALEVTRRSIDAWNRHDADTLVALYDPESSPWSMADSLAEPSMVQSRKKINKDRSSKNAEAQTWKQ
jgi:hypothetical protein